MSFYFISSKSPITGDATSDLRSTRRGFYFYWQIRLSDVRTIPPISFPFLFFPFIFRYNRVTARRNPYGNVLDPARQRHGFRHHNAEKP
ncbi:hypothetical protein M431DRAFT_226965 [Trichoderma harzianum CBS 226.95]|uniref:Uncharacterized protein n=1 Tax=Trichoderma harzianum CBS 226.95 TaxID=983964 RepID=A0A2T4A410_TRIHA|nr:hypothetical protein M431DRAFT_226965 [Trichoderma harzianum CBS 226.95]PTB51786.1 hypothetical protein M431DRAFT_226965 [Trichoderma harzianum CBS 226.95]